MTAVLVALLLSQAAPAEPSTAPTAEPAAAKSQLKAPGLASLQVGGQPKAKKQKEPHAPHTPPGVPPCNNPIVTSTDMPRGAGETIRYVVDVNGLSLGTIDFKIERRGTYSGKNVTEYRSLFKLDSLVSTFLPVSGRAASLVPDAGFAPLAAMSHYTLDKNEFEESQTFSKNGAAVASKRTKNGTQSEDERTFPGPAIDFVSGFYFLRTLPAGSEGCVIIYGNQRAYTVWLKPEGKESIKTPVGFKEADRYSIIYGSDRGKTKATGQIWIGSSADRLPYKAEIVGKDRLEARIHLYENGQAH